MMETLEVDKLEHAERLEMWIVQKQLQTNIRYQMLFAVPSELPSSFIF